MSNTSITLEQNFVQDLIRQAVNQQIIGTIESMIQEPAWVERTDRLINRAIIQSAKDTVINFDFNPVIRECVNENITKFEKDLTGQLVESISKSSAVPSSDVVQNLVEQVIQNQIIVAVEQLTHNSEWLEKIERMINQAVVQRTVATIGSMDVNTVIQQRVDENMTRIKSEWITKFSSTGIDDQATSCQFTVMDETTVVENQLTAANLDVVGSAIIKDLVVKGSINTDNQSWQSLASDIASKTLEQLNTSWKETLVQQVSEQIQKNGINFTEVNINGQPLINNNTLSRAITGSSLQTVGTLQSLSVKGEVYLNETAIVKRGRFGINTQEPEMALSVWDEEVSIVAGKHKAKQAYIGTNRDQTMSIGVNRVPYIDIDIDGLTTIKKLRVGLHKIAHDSMVPGYAGTRGDIVFNSNPGPNLVFAWVCLGGHKWQTLKSAE